MFNGFCTYESFFFQAEDGIRDLTVTGVQTCALPICEHWKATPDGCRAAAPWIDSIGASRALTVRMSCAISADDRVSSTGRSTRRSTQPYWLPPKLKSRMVVVDAGKRRLLIRSTSYHSAHGVRSPSVTLPHSVKGSLPCLTQRSNE